MKKPAEVAPLKSKLRIERRLSTEAAAALKSLDYWCTMFFTLPYFSLMSPNQRKTSISNMVTAIDRAYISGIRDASLRERLLLAEEKRLTLRSCYSPTGMGPRPHCGGDAIQGSIDGTPFYGCARHITLKVNRATRAKRRPR